MRRRSSPLSSPLTSRLRSAAKRVASPSIRESGACSPGSDPIGWFIVDEVIGKEELITYARPRPDWCDSRTRRARLSRIARRRDPPCRRGVRNLAASASDDPVQDRRRYPQYLGRDALVPPRDRRRASPAAALRKGALRVPDDRYLTRRAQLWLGTLVEIAVESVPTVALDTAASPRLGGRRPRSRRAFELHDPQASFRESIATQPRLCSRYRRIFVRCCAVRSSSQRVPNGAFDPTVGGRLAALGFLPPQSHGRARGRAGATCVVTREGYASRGRSC